MRKRCLYVFFYRQDAAKGQTAGIKFTHRPFISFFSPRRGHSLHRFTSNLAGPTGTNQKWSRGEHVIVFRRRPTCDSNSKILLAHALKNFNWCSLYQTESCDDMLAYFMDTLNAMLDYYMPLCPFKRHSSDKPWVTDRFRQLIS